MRERNLRQVKLQALNLINQLENLSDQSLQHLYSNNFSAMGISLLKSMLKLLVRSMEHELPGLPIDESTDLSLLRQVSVFQENDKKAHNL